VENWALMSVDLHQRAFAATAGSPRAAREFVAELLAAHGASNAVIADFRLIVSELVANAVQHGRRPVLVEVHTGERECFEVRVVGGTLPAAYADPERWRINTPDAASGRGLGIVRDRADEVTVTRDADGVHTVTCRSRRSI
jgi:anti-sigma regulatory factor (Ser/Thr protein kinase)